VTIYRLIEIVYEKIRKKCLIQTINGWMKLIEEQELSILDVVKVQVT